MKYFYILIIVGFFSSSSYAQWTNTGGPTGGYVGDIVKIDAYTFVNGGAGGIYRSENNGTLWARVNIGLPSYPHCYAIASSGTTLYASIYQHGVYKSTDFGNTWVSTGQGLEGKTFYSLLADGNDIYAGYSEGGFYYSSNAGNTWVKKGEDLDQVRTFMIAGGDLFVAASISGVSAVFKSVDKGDNLTNLNAPVTHINFMGGSDNAIYLTGTSTAISRDFGTSWTTSDIGTSGGQYTLFALYAQDDKVIIPAGDSTIFISEDEGLNWSTITNLPYGGTVTAIYSEGNSIMLGSNEGFYFTDDNGASWEKRTDGLKNLIITQLEATNSILYAGTPVGIYSSTDNGFTWNNLNTDLINNNGANANQSVIINGIHVNPTNVVIGTSTGIFKSSNNGVNWEIKHSLENVINNGFTAVAGDQEKVVAFQLIQQDYSIDEGEIWTSKTDAIFDGVGVTAAVVKGDTILALAPDKLIISDNFGNSWKSVSVSPNFFMPTDAFFLEDDLYVATYQGIFFSDDLGETWTKLLGLPTQQVRSFFHKNNAIYIGTSEGVFVSYDKGSKWYALNDGMADVSSDPLAFNDLYAFSGTYGMSVWRNSWIDLNVKPVITGLLNPLQYTENIVVPIDINNIQVTDPDNDFPQDFTLTVKPGDHYSVVGNIVTPEQNYRGELQIPLIVNDGHFDSNEYIATVSVITGLPEENLPVIEIFPNPTHSKLNFTLSGLKLYSIKDCVGREVVRNEDATGNEMLHSIDVSHLPSGMYFLELQGKRKHIMRFSKN